ncbi:ATPase domain-containing protein [Thermococcus pacificus]|uniref:non-specific serine/threonine protein kinase n=1 Tax=Thermococcus pacificus TaxID=71998 RepID=A0A218P762_9EURY|nr:ATPase domain-containing protein [Thermococcus pacificus]ASJ06618.1 circadian clock KaiC-like protein [Thermococcus pacificus]
MRKMGIDFFDEQVVEGGFPEGALILVAGEPGSGKTIFSSTWLYNGAKKFGEKGVYISFAETKTDFFEEMKQLGMDFGELEQKGLFKFIDLVTVSSETIEKEIELIMGEILTFQPQRVVLDSISVFGQLMGQAKLRAFLHTTLGRFMKATGATVLLIAEKPMGQEKVGYGIEEFVVDGVIVLKSKSLGESLIRLMEVRKMRRRSIKKPQFEYTISSHGIEFLDIPELRRAEIEPTWEKISTGIKKLDEIVGGGLYRGSSVLLVGMTGTGKTTFALHFAVNNALEGRKALYLAFEEPMDQLLRAAKNYGLPIEKVLNGNLNILNIIPEAHTPVQTFIRIKRAIEEHKPEVLVVDSLTALKQHMNEKELTKMLRYLTLLTKEYRTTIYFTLNDETDFRVVPMTGASTLTDVIIGLRYELVNDRIERRLAVVKARGSNHSRKIYRYEITDEGVVIYE